MKRFTSISIILLLAGALWAAPQNTRPARVSRPTTPKAGAPALPAPVAKSAPGATATKGGTVLPQTDVKVLRPTSAATSVSHATTDSVKVERPTTLVTVERPVTPGSATAAAINGGGSLQSGGSVQSGGSYATALKGASSFGKKSAAVPAAAQLGTGQAGLGQQSAAEAQQKEAQAAANTAPKAEGSQPNLQDVIDRTKMPSGLKEKLKQRAAEAQAANAKKKK